MTGIIDVVDVTKRFGGLAVIEGLTFSLAEGEALGIVGPNGAGKTTTLNLVAGDLAPSAGHVRFKGDDVTGLAAHHRCRLGIGRTAQVPRPFEGLTVFENVLVGASHGGRLRGRHSGKQGGRQGGKRGGRHRGRAAIDTSIAALEVTGIIDRANVRAGDLTLLERKRLELARALATSPTVLLLDELAGGLTEAEVDELVATVGEIHRAGMSIIWIEHVVNALIRTVDRILAMDNGRVLIEGDPVSVMESVEVKTIYLGTEG